MSSQGIIILLTKFSILLLYIAHFSILVCILIFGIQPDDGVKQTPKYCEILLSKLKCFCLSNLLGQHNNYKNIILVSSKNVV